MKSKNTLEIINKYKPYVWKEIEKNLVSPRFPAEFLVPSGFKNVESLHWKIAKEYPLRQGKYLRPILLILTSLSLGSNLRKAIKTAAAIQLSEEWMLVHDDIEDGSILRRGKPTLHKLYGVEMAINAGDTLHSVMWQVLNQNYKILGYEKTTQIQKEFTNILARTTLGQTTELAWTKGNRISISEKEWNFIADGKTAYYTIAGPMRLGALIQGADFKKLQRISQFGIYLGHCFQLTDDILDVTGDFSGNKQLGNDIWEGKRTLILSHLYKKSNTTDRNKIRRIFLKTREEKSVSEVSWIISKMRSYGSINHAQKIAGKYKNLALEYFSENLKFLAKNPYRSELESIIHFITERKY